MSSCKVFSATTFIISLFFTFALYAEGPLISEVPKLPAGTPELPEPSDAGQAGLIINGNNALEFRNVIIPELYEQVRSGIIELDAVRSIKYSWLRDKEWQEQKVLANNVLTENLSLKSDIDLKRGFIFGAQDELAKESDKNVLASKILWNINSNHWGLRYIDLDFNMLWIGGAGVERKLEGNIVRLYPKALISADKSQQLFREKIIFTKPVGVKDLAWITFRLLDKGEDVLWIYSPAIKKARQLTGSNRDDSIIRSALSLDDFLTWSGKTEQVQVVLDKTMVALLPFPDLNQAILQIGADGCYSLFEESEGRPQSLWNYQGKKFPQGAAWLPNYAVFAPRQVYRLELIPLDPYSLYGRQILYVDTMSMLPFYKIVYDKAGRHWKTLISAYGLASSKDNKRKVPYLNFTIVNDQIKNETNIIEYANVNYCDALPSEVNLADFDPRKLEEHMNGSVKDKDAASPALKNESSNH